MTRPALAGPRLTGTLAGIGALVAALLSAVPASAVQTSAVQTSAAQAGPAAPRAGTAHTEPLARHDVDGVTGAAFSVAGELFPGEQNIVTTGYGTLTGGLPSGGGTVQFYRPGHDIATWERGTVVPTSAEIILPNRPTLSDVNEDGRMDVIVPSGYFFDTGGATPRQRSAITWWENRGLDAQGDALGFVRHDVLTGQAGSFHGVEHVDLDGDGIRDLVTTSEEAKAAPNLYDDTVALMYLKGRADHTFEDPVTLADGAGGSLPVVHDVDGDGLADIVSSQYFEITQDTDASFLWFQQVPDSAPGLSEADFVPHTIATMGEVGHGFQIRPMPNFREPGTISWIGANHQNRCFLTSRKHEMVMEFVPGADATQPWTVTEHSIPAEPSATPTACDPAFKAGTVPVHPGGEITSRPTPGQAAPGVFGYGDVDGDGDVDLAVSGDGDRRLFWIEQLEDGATVLHTLTQPGELFGQSGGAAVADLDGDGAVEMVFSSFDESTVALWSRSAALPPELRTVRSTLKVKPGTVTVRKGRRTTWKVSLTAAAGGPRRSVTVTFVPAKGRARKIATVQLRGTSATRAGTLTWRPKRTGRLVFSYRGTTVSEVLKDTKARRTVRVRVR